MSKYIMRGLICCVIYQLCYMLIQTLEIGAYSAMSTRMLSVIITGVVFGCCQKAFRY